MELAWQDVTLKMENFGKMILNLANNAVQNAYNVKIKPHALLANKVSVCSILKFLTKNKLPVINALKTVLNVFRKLRIQIQLR